MFQKILIVSPFCGGMTTTLNALRDCDFQICENIPLSMIQQIKGERLAFGIHSKSPEFSIGIIQDLIQNHGFKVILLSCDKQTLNRRFIETRRVHPWQENDISLEKAIEKDNNALNPIQDSAHHLIDTSTLSVHDLKRVIFGLFRKDSPSFHIDIMSFSFRKQIPQQADLVFNMRFLKNPYWQAALREQTGADKDVQDFIAADPKFSVFMDGIYKLIADLIPSYQTEGVSSLMIAFGCTGGKHRSVYAAIDMYHRFHDMTINGKKVETSLTHRDKPNITK